MLEFTKQCRRCGETKTKDHLKKDSRNGDGYSSFCKKCHIASTKEWQAKNKEKLKRWRKKNYQKNKSKINARRTEKYDKNRAKFFNLQRLYKASQKWYEETLQKQNGCCAICGKSQTEFKRTLAVDHDHKCCINAPTCGECNRGLLCQHCNTSLHALEENKNWIEKATNYINQYGRK